MGGVLRRGAVFLGSKEEYEEAQLVILGAPLDWTISWRPGARLGPAHIRASSEVLEEYSPALDCDLSSVPFYDAGDLELPFGDTAASLALIRESVQRIIMDGKVPLLLGGEHLVTYPAVEAVRQYHPDLAVLHFDAHADLRQEYMGVTLSHATVMRRVLELGRLELYQFGIRSGSEAEFIFAPTHTHFYPFEFREALEKVVPTLAGRPVYITIDIDVVDPAFAPGTGTPEPGGCTAQEILASVYALRDLLVVGFDLVEVAPLYDPSGRTGVLAAKIVREAILAWGSRSQETAEGG
ncbi:MAG: agmatinase [Bacillota bacterium]|nr:agmatinase [Bacillota bacterium]